MKATSDWLTSVRVRRLAQILVYISTVPQDVSRTEYEKLIWHKCGGPLSEIPQLIEILVELKFALHNGETLIRTTAGNRAAKAIRARDDKLLALTLIRAGYFYDQARILLECGRIDESGNLHCETRIARSGAAQLLAILANWSDIQLLPEVFIPETLLQELNTVWALLPPTIELPKWAAERKAIGDRAEMYTVQYERTQVGAGYIFWVSRDSDSLGWDVEDRSVTPHRCIEVKGRRESDIVFYLSDNEWNKAHELGSKYEVQFWGGIDLAVEPTIEYTNLRASGYPIIINDLAAGVGKDWQAVAVRWRITPASSTLLTTD
jgi:hypothetical protein